MDLNHQSTYYCKLTPRKFTSGLWEYEAHADLAVGLGRVRTRLNVTMNVGKKRKR
jgi:hypothetical protein